MFAILCVTNQHTHMRFCVASLSVRLMHTMSFSTTKDAGNVDPHDLHDEYVRQNGHNHLPLDPRG